MMRTNRFETCVEYQVRRAEVDVRGLVHESVYLNWLHEAFLQHLQAQEIDLTNVEGTDYMLRLAEFTGKYLMPARLADLIKVCCWITAVDEMSIGMSYEVLRGDTTLMKGDTRYACVSSAYQAVAIRSDWKFKMEATRNATR